MNRGRLKGFTIIEVMMFLAITGLLVATMLVGSGLAINNQRYIDGINSFKAFFQDEFSQVANVQNDRNNTWQCDSSGIDQVNPSIPDSGQVRGQSDCVILGRLLTVNDGDVTTGDIIGYQTSTVANGTDVSNLKNNWSLDIDQSSIEKSTLQWGTKLTWPTTWGNASTLQNCSTSGSRGLTMMIIRSPDSGTVYSFSSTSAIDTATAKDTDLAKLLVAGTVNDCSATYMGQSEQVLCLSSEGLLSISGGGQSVYIASYATNANAVEIRSNVYMQNNVATGKDPIQC